MNERIKKLAKQAEAYADAMDIGGKNYIDLRDEYFAKLIIKECLDIVNRKEYSYHEADPLWETAELIKEHFGVE